MARKASRTTFLILNDSLDEPVLKYQQRRGFTIVELLIVIVVIAILAAITAVAYSGVQNRARASAAQAAARQAFTAISTYAAQNSDQYPTNAAAAGLADSGSTSYQYRVDNTASPRTFCVTATTSNISYFSSSSSSSPTIGACAGHGVNGGLALTNLVTNPSLEAVGVAPWVSNNASSTVTRSTDRAFSGNASLQVISQNTTHGYNGAKWSPGSLTPGMTYNLSGWVYLPSAYSTSGVAATVTGGGMPSITQGNFVTSAGVWARTSVSFTPIDASSVTVYIVTASSGQAAAGATFYMDAVQVISGGAAATYADGDSPGWAWNGTPNNSTSTGPPL